MSRLDLLIAWYESLCPETLAELPLFYAADARFKDPFNDVRGHAAITAVFAHMFATTQAPRFLVRERLADTHQAFVTWDFEFGLKGRRHTVHGTTRFVFDTEGLVVEHRDYWDAAEELWQQLPVLGPITRWLRRRFASS
ncbi:nuclear transport factor 2 family protein [Chitiniphilus purpureus]|uniref:Nuclear transport factor 2 family protein n=1 Tax=Chitiniphilus purpureus TaxID=2981137 RepID=A0ABY6DNC3_9NEIS|nr:nuclear transport factor 2 family protein [Chitiniphilus sp. CD1]UXY15832.1 nuclear transport factor 2 family protein [Chitiniphilus sp. CD1]